MLINKQQQTFAGWYEVNKIYQWDCLKIIKDKIQDKSIDLLLTDPPYEFINKRPKGWWFMSKENKKYLEDIDNSFWMSYNPKQFLELIKSKMKAFNAYIFTNKNLLLDYISFAEQNWYKRDILLRLKNNPVPINNRHYLIDKEYCVYIKEKWACFNSDLWYHNYFTYETHSIWKKEKYEINWKTLLHPTQKPLDMIERIIKISSKEWDTIIDPYLWSWTTAVACKKLKRNFIGCEINQDYIKIAERRLNEYTQDILPS